MEFRLGINEIVLNEKCGLMIEKPEFYQTIL